MTEEPAVEVDVSLRNWRRSWRLRQLVAIVILYVATFAGLLINRNTAETAGHAAAEANVLSREAVRDRAQMCQYARLNRNAIRDLAMSVYAPVQPFPDSTQAERDRVAIRNAIAARALDDFVKRNQPINC
jgi:hypothetical protein